MILWVQAAADTAIALALVYVLRKQRTGFATYVDPTKNVDRPITDIASFLLVEPILC
jgi:hypothetical protein